MSPRLFAISAILAALALVALIPGRAQWYAYNELHPRREPVPAPPASNLEAVMLHTSDGLTLHGWLGASRNGAAVIFGHGLPGTRLQLWPAAEALWTAGYGVLVFDFRGQGQSEGRPGWGDAEQLDFDAAVSFVRARVPGRIGAVGFSMGGSVVVEVAARDPRVAAVTVQGTFTSLADDIHHSYGRWGPFSEAPARALLRWSGVNVASVRPGDRICSISPRPVLLIYGTRDLMTPIAAAHAMEWLACEPKAFWLVEGAAHGGYRAVDPREYDRRVRAFFDAALLKRPEGIDRSEDSR